MKKVTRRFILGFAFACLFMCILCTPEEIYFQTSYNNMTQDTLTIVEKGTSSTFSNETYTYTLNPNEIGYGGGGCMMRMTILCKCE